MIFNFYDNHVLKLVPINFSDLYTENFNFYYIKNHKKFKIFKVFNFFKFVKKLNFVKNSIFVNFNVFAQFLGIFLAVNF